MKPGRLMMIVLWSLAVLQIPPALAHGLHMTTVAVTLRQGDHLSLTVHTSLTDLFNRMEYDGKPGSVIYLANGSDKEIEQFRQQILSLVKQTPLTVAQQPLQSVEVRMARAEALRELLLNAVAEHVLQAGTAAGASSDPRSNYLRIDIDGFIPKGDGTPVLEANFPQAFGPILFSYSKPQMQTIEPGEHGSHYLQPLQ